MGIVVRLGHTVPHHCFRRGAILRRVPGACVGLFVAGLALADDALHPRGTLDPVTVTGTRIHERAVDAGALGARRVVDTPFSIQTFDAVLIRDQQVRTLGDLLRNDPSASLNFGAGYTSYNGVTLRGFSLGNLTNYRRDGLPFTHLSETPYENVERVEVFKGLSGFVAGFAAPGGLINVVTRKPTDAPLRRVRVGYQSDSLLLAHVDLGGRLGPGERFGYRVNLAYERGDVPVDDISLQRRFASGSFDWRLREDLVLALDAETHRIDPTGQQLYFSLAPGVPVPEAPDLSRNYGLDYSGYDTRDTILGARFAWRPSERFGATLAYHTHDHRRDAWFPSARIIDAAGRFVITPSRDALQEYPIEAAQALVTGEFATGPVRHALTAGWTWARDVGWRGDYVDSAPVESSFAAPLRAPFAPIFAARDQYRSAVTRQDGAFVSNTLGFGRVDVVLGLRSQRLRTENFRFTGVRSARYDARATTPTVAVVWRPADALSLYASRIEALERGGTAPASAANAGEVFGPLESEQIEVGAKWSARDDLLLTLALFDVDKGLEYLDPASRRFVQDGLQEHRGVEFTVVGRLAPRLEVSLGGLVMDTTAERTGNVAIDGRRPAGVPERKFTAYASYEFASLAGFALNAGVERVDDIAFDANNARFVPARTLYTAGARFATTALGAPSTWRLTIENLTDERYWAAASGSLYLGTPRTVKLSAEFAL